MPSDAVPSASAAADRTPGAADGAAGAPARGRRQRLDRILDLVIERGHVRVDELAADLGTSPATVRRDLDSLAAQQLVIRSHGGASAHPDASALPMRYRSTRHADAKDAIARAAVDMIEPGTVVGMNGGTTTTALAHELAARDSIREAPRPTTLVTNALNIAQELAVRRHLQLVVTGGIVRGGSFELVGGWAEQMLEQIRIDLLFLGVDGISARDGACTHDEAEALISARLADRAEKVVVLADSSKIGGSAFARIQSTEGLDAVVTDPGADPDAVAALRGAGVEIVVAKEGSR
ncbi:DeoR/GlpR family DNA-binding transcription regulator [Brachybacterium subflavum]|uniref:DeoR/GlpR family DNA-binding transcription regulator n=1 Tax=Brachybacterium subflavum TaxID=2585206 RepID=UPI001D0CE664|nr:DeoR/GlpR family DNA-binding transcription regulator [Brachybacterium subflavum]